MDPLWTVTVIVGYHVLVENDNFFVPSACNGWFPSMPSCFGWSYEEVGRDWYFVKADENLTLIEQNIGLI